MEVFLIELSSIALAGSPVAEPVIITPSDEKNSAALTVSSIDTSDVIAWALKINYLLIK